MSNEDLCPACGHLNDDHTGNGCMERGSDGRFCICMLNGKPDTAHARIVALEAALQEMMKVHFLHSHAHQDTRDAHARARALLEQTT